MPSTNALHTAAKAGNVAQVRSQVRNFDINAQIGSVDCTALALAAREGHTEVVKLLLTFNPDVNLPDRSGYTPLNYAARYGHTEIVRALLQVDDIDVNDANMLGETPLEYAAWNGHTEIVRALLQVDDIDVNHADQWGYTPLHRAANNGHTETVQALLQVDDIDVDRKTKYGSKAIEIAKTEEIKALIRNAPAIRAEAARKRREGGGGKIGGGVGGGGAGGGGAGGIPPTRKFRPYIGPASMTFRDTSRSVLASGRTIDAHAAAAAREERAAQELSFILDGLCKSGQFPDLSAVTRVLAKPTGQSVVFGGVYQGQQVAVKVFRDRTTTDTAAKEVAYLRRCAHRHVLGALTTYEFNERALLVMPMADGDLNAVIEKAEGPLPHDQVTRYVKQVATALTFLHDEKRVAHLDLKPGNVFIAKSDKRALLADFGMAMDITDVSRDQLLNCGTPLFMAPELWADRLGDPVQRATGRKWMCTHLAVWCGSY